MTIDYINQYLEEGIQISRSLDREAIGKVVDLLFDLQSRGGRLFIIGVGGGAGHDRRSLPGYRSDPERLRERFSSQDQDEPGWRVFFSRPGGWRVLDRNRHAWI